MADSDKNIVITPNISSSSDNPKIVFSGADSSTAAQNITLYTYPTDNGTLSFEGSAGQLFSITNDLTGTIFSVNDVSGIPSIEVDADGSIRLAEFGGTINLGGVTTVQTLRDTVYTLSGTVIDPANGGTQLVVLTANTTFTESLQSGDAIVLQIENGTTYTVTWPTIVWTGVNGNTAPTLTAKDALVLWKVSNTLYAATIGSYA